MVMSPSIVPAILFKLATTVLDVHMLDWTTGHLTPFWTTQYSCSYSSRHLLEASVSVVHAAIEAIGTLTEEHIAGKCVPGSPFPSLGKRLTGKDHHELCTSPNLSPKFRPVQSPVLSSPMSRFYSSFAGHRIIVQFRVNVSCYPCCCYTVAPHPYCLRGGVLQYNNGCMQEGDACASILPHKAQKLLPLKVIAQ